jgi:hypothetical protein
MSVRVPPFRIGPDSEEEGEDVPSSISITRVHEALVGRDRKVSVRAALNLVASAALPEQVELYAGVLRNRELGPDPRRHAAILLGYAGGPASQAVLLESLSDPEPRVRAAAAKALGWIGDAGAYAPLIALARQPPGIHTLQAEWAARLIAHRHGLAAPELPPLRLGAPVAFTAERRPVQVLAARPAQLRRCLESTSRRNFGLRWELSLAHELHCGRTEWMLLVTADAARAPASLIGRRSIAGAAALFVAEEQSYAIALLALVEPTAQVIACRSTGAPLFAGALRGVDDATVAFSLQALERPGAFPLQFGGSLAPASLRLGDVSAGPVTIAKRQPTPIEFDPRR